MTLTLRLALFATCAALLLGAPTAAMAATEKAGKTASAKSKKAASAPAEQNRIGIAAVVNDDIITFSDIEDRMRLYLLSAPKNLPPEAKQRVLQQTMYRLVDEKLQLQEASALNIRVSDADIARGFSAIANQNKMEPDQFGEQLKRAGINLDTLQEQIRAEIAWSQVVRRKLRPQIVISETEIDSEVDRLQRSSGRMEYRIAEIFLSFDGEASEKNARELAERLSAEIRKGRPFSQAAREFSEAPGAATGGDLGWIEEGTLSGDLNSAIAALKPGQLSEPIRTDKGYHLIFLRDARQKGMPAGAATATPAPAAETAPQEKRPSLVTSEGPAPELPPQASNDAPKIIDPVPAAEAAASAPAPAAGTEGAREEIATRLGTQRLEQMAERYLHDLRATAFIEQRF